MNVQIDKGRIDIERVRQEIDKGRIDIDRVRQEIDKGRIDIDRVRQEMEMENKKFRLQVIGTILTAIGVVVGAFAAGAAWEHYLHGG